MNTMDNITRRNDDEDYEDNSTENVNCELKNEESRDSEDENSDRRQRLRDIAAVCTRHAI